MLISVKCLRVYEPYTDLMVLQTPATVQKTQLRLRVRLISSSAQDGVCPELLDLAAVPCV